MRARSAVVARIVRNDEVAGSNPAESTYVHRTRSVIYANCNRLDYFLGEFSVFAPFSFEEISKL